MVFKKYLGVLPGRVHNTSKNERFTPEYLILHQALDQQRSQGEGRAGQPREGAAGAVDL